MGILVIVTEFIPDAGLALPADAPAVVGYYDPQTGATQTFSLPAGEIVANCISSSPAGVAVTTTSR